MSKQSNKSSSFVRQTLLAERTPPAGETGMLKWVRENLFSSALNIILTLICVPLIIALIAAILPWFTNAVWHASNIAECRDILSAIGLKGDDGACFGVIKDRWHQLMFGFYPAEHYWRPILALAIFLIALMPILFLSVPRFLLVVTCLSPFACFWLLWGGSIWLPLVVLLGFVIGFMMLRYMGPVLGTISTAIMAILVPVLFWLFSAGPLSDSLQSILPMAIEQVPSRAFGGFMLSAVIGLSAIVLSLPLGVLLALARQSSLPIIKWSAVSFIEIGRGVPMIVWLFTAQLLLNYFLPPGSNLDLTLRVIIMVTLLTAADLAEIVRGGLAALPKGQYEGADSLGLSYWQSARLIILPQALRVSIPNIVNSFIGLFKDTTLVVFIGLLDPLGFVGAIRATSDWNGIYWELFLFVGVLFFIACYAMARYAHYLEKMLGREHR